MKIQELLTEKEQSLSKNLNPLTRTEKNMYFLVQDATSQSEGGDVIAHVDGNSFAHIFIGADHGETAAKENWVLYHDNQKDEAIADANERLKYAKSEYTVTESTLFEGFKNRLSGGKVPIGDYTFNYTGDNLKFIKNSAKTRKMKVEKDGDSLRITGSAGDHSSLIHSFQSLGINGEVVG